MTRVKCHRQRGGAEPRPLWSQSLRLRVSIQVLGVCVREGGGLAGGFMLGWREGVRAGTRWETLDTSEPIYRSQRDLSFH